MMPGQRPAVRLASPTSFPTDPRYEQTRFPIDSILPARRIFDERHQRHPNRLLDLPDEILSLITMYLAEENQGRELSQFALAHRECRQLARPYQFADVWITRSDTSEALVQHLLKEDLTNSPEPIGGFIRSLTITVDKDYDYEFEQDNEGWEAWEQHWQGFIDDLGRVVQKSMANLQHVYWMAVAELDPREHLLPAVLQHAAPPGRLERLCFEDYGLYLSAWDDPTRVLDLFPTEQDLHLRHISFGLSRFSPEYTDPDGMLARFVETLLRRSASTLESFVWNTQAERDWGDGGFSTFQFKDGPIQFPKLRGFWSHVGDGISPRVLDSYLSGPLEVFAPSKPICEEMVDNGAYLKYTLPHLRKLIVAGSSYQYHYMPELIRDVLTLGEHYGTQLEELFVYPSNYFATNHGMGEELTTLFSRGSYSNLRTLCFSWPDGNTSMSVLQAFGATLLALEEISFGVQPDDERTSAAIRSDQTLTMASGNGLSHESIISALSPLQRLVRIGVFGDEYVADWAGDHWAWHRFYKDHVWFNQGRSFIERESGSRPGEGQTWAQATRGHKRTGDLVEDWGTPWLTGTDSPEEARHAVVGISERYAVVFPRLKEFMCGRVLVEIMDR